MGHSSMGYGVPSFRVWCSSACMFFPINSAGSSYPSMRAAARFEKRQMPSESQPQIASAAESRIKRIRSSLLCRAFSACVRIVLSSESGIVRLPCSRNTKTSADEIQRVYKVQLPWPKAGKRFSTITQRTQGQVRCLSTPRKTGEVQLAL